MLNGARSAALGSRDWSRAVSCKGAEILQVLRRIWLLKNSSRLSAAAVLPPLLCRDWMLRKGAHAPLKSRSGQLCKSSTRLGFGRSHKPLLVEDADKPACNSYATRPSRRLWKGFGHQTRCRSGGGDVGGRVWNAEGPFIWEKFTKLRAAARNLRRRSDGFSIRESIEHAAAAISLALDRCC